MSVFLSLWIRFQADQSEDTEPVSLILKNYEENSYDKKTLFLPVVWQMQ